MGGRGGGEGGAELRGQQTVVFIMSTVIVQYLVYN